MAGGHHGGGGGNGNGLTFGFSHLLAEKMGRTHQLASSLLSNGVGSLVGIGSASSSSSSSSFSARSEYMVTRCPSGTLAQLNHEGVCSCGTLGTTHAECPGYEENDRRTVCVQNLQRDMQNTGNRMRLPTCGLEFLPQFGPSSCPVGYNRVGTPTSKSNKKKNKNKVKGKAVARPDDDDDDVETFICQDAASPYSCGPTSTDCTASKGVLTALCVDQACEILMCREGWSFHVEPDGLASCVPAKPLFYRPE